MTNWTSAMSWIAIENRLPEAGFDLLLVRVVNSELPALAVFVGEGIEGHWKVQPLFAAWYTTNMDVTHWKPIR